jgi:hypothetical protein
MKQTFVLLALSFLLTNAHAQLTVKAKCDPFVVDVLNGTVNRVKANYTLSEIKDKFPCFTTAEEEGSLSKCGGGVFFKDKDLYFYTQRDYIEIGPNFKGKLSIPLLGASRSSLFKTLGTPQLKDDTWDAFQTQYGVMVLHYSGGKVRRIQMSTQNTSTLQLCDQR